MVLSVVAIGGVGLAGSAVAQEEDPGGEDGPDAIVYDFTIDGDGGPYTLGVPGPVVGTVDEMIDGDLGDEGAVYAYDAAEGWQSVEGDSELEALDAVTILPGEENASDEIGIEVALEAGASPTETALDEGWNFVSANQFSDAEQAFGQWTDGNMVLDRFEGAQAFDVETVDAGSDTYAGADPFDVSAFEGYFVYTNSDDDGIPTAMSDVQSKDDVVDQLGMSEPTVSIDTFDLSLDDESIVTDDSADAALGLEPVVSAEASSTNGMGADVTEDATIESSDEEVATVEDGVITTYATGTATISAEYLGASASVELTVTEPEVVEHSIGIRDTLSEEDAQTGTVTAIFTDDSTETVTNQLSISSDAPDVASVTEEGESFVVSGEGTGTANITASEDGGDVVVEHEVTVSDAEIDVEASEATGGAGYTATIGFNATSLVDSEVPVNSYTIALESGENAELVDLIGADYKMDDGTIVVSETPEGETPTDLFEAEFLIDESASVDEEIPIEFVPEQSEVIEEPASFTAPATYALPSWTDGSIEVADVDTGTVEGTITDDDTDAPIEGATVETEYWSTETDENGEYSLELEPGEYTLDISHETYPDESVDVTVEADETANGDLSIVPLDFRAYVQGQEGYLDTNSSNDEIEPIEFTETEGFDPTQDAIDAEPEYLPEPEPILMEGIIDEETGDWHGEIDFPLSVSESEHDLLGDLYTSAQITATDGVEGTIDRETGEMTLETEVDISISIYNVEEHGTPWKDRGDPITAETCHIPNVDLGSTTGESGSLNGEPLEDDTAVLVSNDFAIESAEGCGTFFGQDLNGAVDDAQGIPTDAGDAEVLFDFAFDFIEPTAPANYDVTIDTEASDSEVEQGSDLSVTATVKNTGDVDGEQQSISLDFGDDTGVASEDVTLTAGESQDVTLTHTVPAQATAESTSVTVDSEDDTDSYDVTVVEPSAPAYYDVTSIDAPDSATAGEEITVDYTVENTGDETATQDIEFLVEGESVDTNGGVELGTGETVTDSFTYTPTEGEAGGTITVEVSTDDASSNAGVTVQTTAGTVTGTVTDDSAESNSIQAATVGVEGEDISATTDSNGDYTLENVPEGDQDVAVSADGYESSTATVTVEADGSVTHDVSLTELAPSSLSVEADSTNIDANDGSTDVTATVNDQNDEAYEGESVTFAVEGDDGSLNPTSATTDENGEATVSFEADGAADVADITITATADSDDSVSDTVDVTIDAEPAPEPDTVDAQVTTDNAAADDTEEVTFTVTVTEGETPVKDVTVSPTDTNDIDSVNGLTPTDEETTNADGEVTFTATADTADSYTIEFEEQMNSNTDTAEATFEEPTG